MPKSTDDIVYVSQREWDKIQDSRETGEVRVKDGDNIRKFTKTEGSKLMRANIKGETKWRRYVVDPKKVDPKKESSKKTIGSATKKLNSQKAVSIDDVGIEI